MSLVFLILAVLTLAGAAAAMSLRMLVHCALALIVAFAGLAAIYIALGAQFVGLSQILVYVGAVAILIVFVILLTRDTESASRPVLSLVRPGSPLASLLVTAAVFAVLAWAIYGSKVGRNDEPAQASSYAPIKLIGNVLLQRFVLPLEILGLMLTVALIGAVILAMQEKGRAQ